jgi:hypothetical protein
LKVKFLEGSFVNFDMASGFAGNRFAALEDVKNFLELVHVDWRGLFEVLCKAEGGYIGFNFGGVNVEFDCNNIFPEDEKTIILSIEVEKHKMGNTATYEFTVKELEALIRKRQLKIDGFGE